VINGVYIFWTSGLPIFHTTLDSGKAEINQILFAGISSAINMFIKELAHSDLESINIEDGTLKYSVHKELIFVIHCTGKKGSHLGGFLLWQIRTEFLKQYAQVIENSPDSFVDSSLFHPFDSTVNKIHNDMLLLFDKHENLFNYIPPKIPLSLIQELLKEGDNLIEGFPNDTIRLIRRLDTKYEEEVKEPIMFSLGVYFGIEISKKIFPNRVGINQTEVLKLLNEISVAKLDKKSHLFTLTICPICRGKSSTDPMCHFFAGFIEGGFDNPKLHIIEETCKAKGDQYCTFKISSNRDTHKLMY
jgi:predicted hydrocarbon binding protein